MEVIRLPVTAADGHRFEVVVCDPAPGRPVVLVLPAMGVMAEYYRPVIEELAATGLAAAAADLRGHGRSELRARRGVDWGYRELVEVDLPATLVTLRAALGNRPIYALGHSLGGQIACLHAAAFPGELAGVALIASCTVYFRCWGMPRGLGTLAFTQSVGLVTRVLGYFPGDRLHFAGREGRQQMLDWAGNGRSGRWVIGGSEHDYDSRLRDVKVPLLGMSLEGDGYAPRRAVDMQLGKMPEAPLTRIHWTERDLGKNGMHHIRWVRHSGPIVAAVRAWIG